ncbi:YqaA family protein [Brevibacillus sp. TJ4]|uniref:YqaA family protein n=1 Tax=Brevibacillus sp. TJ4 TaxID=3234853 RepID=UPI0037D80328
MFAQLSQFFMDYGNWGLFIVSLLDSFLLPLPPFFLQIGLSLIQPTEALWIALIAFTGSLLGAPVGYVMGKWLGQPILNRLLPEKWTLLATKQFEKNGDAAVLVGSFTPIPFKVFTILCGVFNYSLTKLMLFAILGRGMKFFLIGFLFYFYGKHAKELLDTYMEASLLAAAAAVAIIWIVVKQLAKKRR